MPITFMKSYLACDGKCYPTITEAQEVEIEALLSKASSGKDELVLDARMPAFIVSNKDAIVNILTLTDSSRPRARGVKRPRKPKVAVDATKAA